MEINISLITDKKLIGWHGLDALNGFANSLLLNSITCPPVTGPAWSPEAPPCDAGEAGEAYLPQRNSFWNQPSSFSVLLNTSVKPVISPPLGRTE